MTSTRDKYSIASLAIAIGIAAIACRAGPAVATLMPLTPQSFSLTESIPGFFQTDVTNGGSTGSPLADTKSFAQFNIPGATLNSVEIVVSTTNASVSAAIISFDCGIDCCSGDATNTSTFKVTVDGLSPSTQGPFNQKASVACGLPTDDCIPDTANPLSDTPAPFQPPLSDFTFNINSGLSAFIGSGTFDVSPDLTLAALFNAQGLSSGSQPPMVDNGTQMTTETDWKGSIAVTYDYTAPSNGVPEPASLLLIGTALAVLGFSRSIRKRS
jgi:hypothetical protein